MGVQPTHQPWLTILLILCLSATAYAAAASEHGWYRRASPHNQSTPYKPALRLSTSCPKLRIGVLNGVNFHFEVLASLLQVLRPYSANVDVILSPHAQHENFDGAWDIIRWFPGRILKTQPSSVPKDAHYGLLFLVSTDYEMPTIEDMVRVMRPQMVVAYIHNAFFPTAKVLKLAPRVELVALSPHVSHTLAQAANRSAEWLLPVWPLPVIDDCLTYPPRWVLGLCLRGFAMQGKFSNLRRNYSSIWRQMDERLDAIRDPQVSRVLHVNVLGKGKDRLALPPHLETHVRVYRRLIYEEFFNVIAHNVALVPSLASDKYYTEKFSSTILAALITGTPLLADDRIMKAYSFLTPESVYMSQPGEGDVDTMIRVASMTAEQILQVRLALMGLRDRLNDRAARIVEPWVRDACTART